MEVFVRGGTNAGIKPAPRAQVKKSWRCSKCQHENKYYWITCAYCGAKQPDREG